MFKTACIMDNYHVWAVHPPGPFAGSNLTQLSHNADCALLQGELRDGPNTSFVKPGDLWAPPELQEEEGRD